MDPLGPTGPLGSNVPNAPLPLVISWASLMLRFESSDHMRNAACCADNVFASGYVRLRILAISLCIHN
jgi:hypothetical protein